MQNKVTKLLEENIEVIRGLKTQAEIIVEIAESLIETFRSGGKVLFFGNGGSAADAQHLTAEFIGRFKLEREALPAIALNANSSTITSIGNDYSFEETFARQVEALGKTGDLAIALSTTGNSQNVLSACISARKRKMKIIGLSGGGGGKLRELVDICLVAPTANTPRIQESHITAGHIIAELVEEALNVQSD